MSIYFDATGNFDWTSGRFPAFTSPAEGYHGLKFSETFGKPAFAMKLRLEILRDLGPSLNPFAAFLTVGMMLSHLGWPEEERRIEGAIRGALAAGKCTRDVGGDLGTKAAIPYGPGRCELGAGSSQSA